MEDTGLKSVNFCVFTSTDRSPHMNILYSIDGGVVAQTPFIAGHGCHCSILNYPHLAV